MLILSPSFSDQPLNYFELSLFQKLHQSETTAARRLSHYFPTCTCSHHPKRMEICLRKIQNAMQLPHRASFREAMAVKNRCGPHPACTNHLVHQASKLRRWAPEPMFQWSGTSKYRKIEEALGQYSALVW